MVAKTQPLPLGQILATHGALEALKESGESSSTLLSRYAAGDWGERCIEDRHLNDDAVTDGSRILSGYTLRSGVKIWIVTDAVNDYGQRPATTILLPEEY